MYEYFKLSKQCRSSVELESMFRFLRFKEIGCCIVKQGHQKFYVFREGKEETLYGTVGGTEPLNGEIVMSFDPNGVFSD